MNRFWIVLPVLFSMNLTTSVPVSADNYSYKNGVDAYEKGIEHFENERYREGKDSFEAAINFLEEALEDKLAPSQKNQARLRLGISRYYFGRVEGAIESLGSSLRQGKLNDKHQAEAHFYWGMSLLAIRKRPEAQKQFEKALKLNSSLKFPSSLEYNNQAKDLFEETRKKILIVDKTPPTIRLIKPDKDTFEVNEKITIEAKVTDDTSVKEVFVHFSPTDKRPLVKKQHFSNTYTRNISEGSAKSIRYHLTATDEAGNESRYLKKGELKITVVELPSDKTPPTVELPSDKTPPTIRLIKPDKDTFEVNEKITIEAKVTDDTSVKEVFVHFSPTDKRPLVKKQHFSNTYTRNISEGSAKSIRYHLTATDEAGNESRYLKKGELKITVVELPSDKTPPTIRLIKPDKDTFEVNEKITIRAEVTDDTSVKEVLVHFSSTDKQTLSKERASGIYTRSIWSENAGSIRYHLTATDEAGNESRYLKKGELKIIVVEPPSDKTPPTIHLIKPRDGAKFKVNQRITIEAEVTDAISVEQVRLFYGFSEFSHVEPAHYDNMRLTETSSGIYTGYISESETGYIWYYLTATDGRNSEGKSKPRRIEIKPRPFFPTTSKLDPPMYQGIWANYAWSTDVFKDGASFFDLGRDVLSLTYLREGKGHGTRGVQLSSSYQNRVKEASLTGQWGPALGQSPIVFTVLGGIVNWDSDEPTFIELISGLSLKGYLWDRVTVDVTGSINLSSVWDARAAFDNLTEYPYHCEVGIRFYIYRAFNLRVGYRWYLGNRSTTGVQFGLGYTF